MPLYEFYCTTTECHEKGNNYDNTPYRTEYLVKFDEKVECPGCGLDMKKYVSAAHGYVKYSENPVKQ